jgi:hypothetical protein
VSWRSVNPEDGDDVPILVSLYWIDVASESVFC